MLLELYRNSNCALLCFLVVFGARMCADTRKVGEGLLTEIGSPCAPKTGHDDESHCETCHMPRCLKEANLLKPRVSNQKEIEIHIKKTWKFEEISLTDHVNPAVFRRFNLGPRCKSPFPKCVSQAQAPLAVSAL